MDKELKQRQKDAERKKVGGKKRVKRLRLTISARRTQVKDEKKRLKEEKEKREAEAKERKKEAKLRTKANSVQAQPTMDDFR